MPHILIKPNLASLNLSEIDGVKFIDEFRGIKENKILVEVENHQFLLTKIKKNKQYLIKIDKTSRVPILHNLKKALNAYAKLVEADILFSNINSKKNPIKPKDKFLKDIDFFLNNSFYGNFKKNFIEIGFGSGRHLLYQATNNQDSLIIGLEIHTPSINQVLKQIKLQNLKNIYILNYDARIFLELLQSNIVDKIFVHFPVPWDDKPHRRVVSKKFIDESLRVLKKDGFLEIRTDSLNYYNYSKKIIESLDEYRLNIKKNIPLEVTSKYEDRWIRLDKDIWELKLFSLKNTETKNLNFEFIFDKITFDFEKLKNIELKPIVKEDFFIHFKKIYKSNDKILVELSFGDFDRAINLYLLIEGDSVTYFAKKLVPTKINIKIHNFLNEYLKRFSK